MHCMYCSMPKGTYRSEATSNIENIKPVALAVVYLYFSENIRQTISRSVENSIEFKIYSEILEVELGDILLLLVICDI